MNRTPVAILDAVSVNPRWTGRQAADNHTVVKSGREAYAHYAHKMKSGEAQPAKISAVENFSVMEKQVSAEALHRDILGPLTKVGVVQIKNGMLQPGRNAGKFACVVCGKPGEDLHAALAKAKFPLPDAPGDRQAMCLRKDMIRLAYTNPAARREVLATLHTAADPKYQDYMQRKQKDGEKPLPQDEWEAKVLGKKDEGKGGEAKKDKGEDKKDKGEKDDGPDKKVKLTDKKLIDDLFQWQDEKEGVWVASLASNASAGKEVPRSTAEKALKYLEREKEYGWHKRNLDNPEYKDEAKKGQAHLEKCIKGVKKLLKSAASGKYPELDHLARDLAGEVSRRINKKVQPVQSAMPYKAQYVLEELIKHLEAMV